MNDEILKIGFEDGEIKKIIFEFSDILVSVEKWNNEIIHLKFQNCWKFTSNMPINNEIGEIQITDSCEEINILKNEIVADGGKSDSIESIYKVTFFSAWGENEILTILYENSYIMDNIG